MPAAQSFQLCLSFEFGGMCLGHCVRCLQKDICLWLSQWEAVNGLLYANSGMIFARLYFCKHLNSTFPSQNPSSHFSSFLIARENNLNIHDQWLLSMPSSWQFPDSVWFWHFSKRFPTVKLARFLTKLNKIQPLDMKKLTQNPLILPSVCFSNVNPFIMIAADSNLCCSAFCTFFARFPSIRRHFGRRCVCIFLAEPCKLKWSYANALWMPKRTQVDRD